MKKCLTCGCENNDDAVSCSQCSDISFDCLGDPTIRLSLLARQRKRLLFLWILTAGGLGTFLLFISGKWYQKLIGFFVFQILIGAWFLLLNFVQTRAMDASAKGKEFRTGGVPKWRIAIYVLIAMAIPAYFSYPQLRELRHGGLLLCVALLIPAGMVMFFSSIPSIAKKHRSWIVEHKTLLLRLVYVAIALNVLLKLWDMSHAK